MAVYIDKEITIQAIREIPRGNWSRNRFIAEVMSIPEADVVKRDCYDRILWENDVMRKQLAEIGKSFGEKMGDVQKVVHAKAIKFYNDPFTGRMFTTCTACDGKISSKDAYCKYCGAKMDLE